MINPPRFFKRLFVLAPCVCALASSGLSTAADALPDTTLNYAENTALIANPERGFYRSVDCNNPLSAYALQAFRTTDADSLVLCAFYLSGSKTSPISQATLDLFQQQMNMFRNAGLKAVLRFA